MLGGCGGDAKQMWYRSLGKSWKIHWMKIIASGSWLTGLTLYPKDTLAHSRTERWLCYLCSWSTRNVNKAASEPVRRNVVLLLMCTAICVHWTLHSSASVIHKKTQSLSQTLSHQHNHMHTPTDMHPFSYMVILLSEDNFWFPRQWASQVPSTLCHAGSAQPWKRATNSQELHK